MDKQKAISELTSMGIIDSACSLLQSKAGVHVYRVEANGEKLILKVFDNSEDAREIENYHLLQMLGIPTLPLLAETAHTILLPDVTASLEYRLGVESDMNDPEVMQAVAKWYKELHTKGGEYLLRNTTALYDETDMLTLDNIEKIAEVTNTKDSPIWSAIAEKADIIRDRINGLPRTLTYNDFYYTNLIVSQDRQTAFMFDYNLLGKGYAYGDIRNVVSSLSDEAAKAFVNAYGMDDTFAEQAVADAFLAPIITLCYACKRDSFPAWAKLSLEQAKDGRMHASLDRWLGI